MQSRTLTWILVLTGVLLGACGAQSNDDAVDATQQATSSSTTTTESAGVAANTTDTTSAAAESEPPVTDRDDTESAPDGAGLGVDGPYGVGLHNLAAVDSARDRTLRFSVWYPATTVPGSIVEIDAPADRSRAPYPVVAGSMRGASLWGPHFASHGYVFVGSPGIPEDGWDTWILDYALDRLLALDQLEAVAEEPLDGLADTRRTGVIDYSFGTIPTMLLAGARIDPDSYLTSCAGVDVAAWLRENNCRAADEWDTFVRHAVDLGIATEEGLWREVTDGRITAVVPGAPEGGWLFGEDGLRAATVPVLFMTGSADDLNGYELETAFMYRHVGSPADLVTFVGGDHFMILSSDGLEQFKRFATAFFGLHLKEDDRYSHFLSAEFVELAPTLGTPPEVYESLTWGLYTD